VLTGEDAQYFDALDDGADGAILLSAHFETGTFASVGKLLREGNRDAALLRVAELLGVGVSSGCQRLKLSKLARFTFEQQGPGSRDVKREKRASELEVNEIETG
jgi:hypothetical protein